MPRSFLFVVGGGFVDGRMIFGIEVRGGRDAADYEKNYTSLLNRRQ